MSPKKLTILLLLVLAVALTRAGDVIGKVEVSPTSATSVTIKWQTNVPTGTRVAYGLSAERLNRSAEGPVTLAHEVALTGLQPGTRYFFTVGTARKELAAGEFVTSSSPASAAAPVSTSPAAKPAATPKPSLLERILNAGAPPTAPPATGNAPPSRQTWGNPGSLQDHFVRHGPDFGSRTADEYAAQAWRFRQRAKTGALQVKVDANGVQRVYDPVTGAFAAYNPDGTTKTYFKPGSRGYFERQPGRPVKAVTP